MSDQFFYFYQHIFGHISSILVIKQVLDNIFQSTIVTYNFCMIPHSLIFSFILAHFGLRQNPTGLQEAIQGLDKNSMTTLIIKTTLERLFLVKKHQKKPFLEFCPFHQIQPSHGGTENIMQMTPIKIQFCNQNYIQLYTNINLDSNNTIVTYLHTIVYFTQHCIESFKYYAQFSKAQKGVKIFG